MLAALVASKKGDDIQVDFSSDSDNEQDPQEKREGKDVHKFSLHKVNNAAFRNPFGKSCPFNSLFRLLSLTTFPDYLESYSFVDDMMWLNLILAFSSCSCKNPDALLDQLARTFQAFTKPFSKPLELR